MLRALLCVGALVVSGTAFGASIEVCTLGKAAKLFAGPDGTQARGRLEAGTQLVLKVNKGARTLVKTSTGKIGYVDAAWAKKICKMAAMNAPWALDAPKQAAAPSDWGSGGNVIDNAAAIQDVVRAASEGGEASAASTQRLDDARSARAASRSNDCEDTRSAGAYRIAVFAMEQVNVPDGLTKIVVSSLLSEVRKLEGVSAIGQEEIEAMISFERERRILGCEADNECLAEIAGALGVDEVITGRLSEEADGRQMLIRRIDQRRAEVIASENKRLKIGDGGEFLLAIGPMIQTLYPNRDIRPGTTRGVPKEVLLRLNPPPLPSWATLATYGAAVAAASLGGFAYLQRDAAQADLDALNQKAAIQPGEISGPESDWNTYNSMVDPSLYAAGGLAVSAIVMSFFTDWLGYGDEDE